MDAKTIFTGASWIHVFATGYPSKQEADAYRKDSDRSLSDRHHRLMIKAGMAVTTPWSIGLAIGLVGLSAFHTIV
jgi:hypothetical protein